MLGFKVKALDDCGAFPRYEPLGCIIWAQVTPGLLPLAEHPRRLHAGGDEQVAGVAEPRLLADAAALADRADLRHRRRTSSGSTRSRCASRTTSRPSEMPYETPNGCVYDSGDYARCLDIALELIDYDTIEERRARGGDARQAARDRDRLDARLRHEQLRPVDAPQPGAPVLGQQRGGDGEARHLRRDRRHARHRAAGPGPRDDGVAGRRRHPRLLARPGARAARATTRYWNSHAGFSGTYASQFAVTGLGAVKGAAEQLRAEMITLAAAVLAGAGGAIELADGFARIKDGPPEAALPFMALGAIVNANNAFLPPDFNPTLNHRFVYRPYFGMVDTEKKIGQADADLRDADPRVRGRDRPGDRASSRSSTTPPSTTAAPGSTRRSSRARCTARPRTRSAPPSTRTSSTTRTGSC